MAGLYLTVPGMGDAGTAHPPGVVSALLARVNSVRARRAQKALLGAAGARRMGPSG